MRSPWGLITGDLPWARRFLSERLLVSGGGWLSCFRRSGGIKSVYSCLGLVSTAIPIISAPRRKMSGAKRTKVARRPWRKIAVKKNDTRRQRTSSGSRSSKSSSWGSGMARAGVREGGGAQSSESWSPGCGRRLYQGFGVDQTLCFFPRNMTHCTAASKSRFCG
jgi:hypothetical protein